MKLKIGQVLWLKLPFGDTDDISQVYHPYLILDISGYGISIVEVGQMDSENDRPWEVLRGKKIPVDNANPKENVIYTLSYLQTDRKIQIEYFDELVQYLDTEETLSPKKLQKVVNGYYDRRMKYGSDNFRDMYFQKDNILELNPIEEWEEWKTRRLRKYGLL